jgi:hypothetical protein
MQTPLVKRSFVHYARAKQRSGNPCAAMAVRLVMDISALPLILDCCEYSRPAENSISRALPLQPSRKDGTHSFNMTGGRKREWWRHCACNSTFSIPDEHLAEQCPATCEIWAMYCWVISMVATSAESVMLCCVPCDRGTFRAAKQQGAIGLAWARALRMGANEPQCSFTRLSMKA